MTAPDFKLSNDTVFNDQISIMQTLHMIHLFTFQFPHALRQYSRQRTYIIYYTQKVQKTTSFHLAYHCYRKTSFSDAVVCFFVQVGVTNPLSVYPLSDFWLFQG